MARLSVFSFEYGPLINLSLRPLIYDVVVSKRIALWFMKPGVNFINILCAAFSYECFARETFLYLDLRFELFWRKNIGAKAARIMLAKLTPSYVWSEKVSSKFLPENEIKAKKYLVMEKNKLNIVFLLLKYSIEKFLITNMLSCS